MQLVVQMYNTHVLIADGRTLPCRWSMIESVAYSLNQLAQQNTWVAALEPGFSQIPWSKCCYGGGGLPDEFVAAMQNAAD